VSEEKRVHRKVAADVAAPPAEQLIVIEGARNPGPNCRVLVYQLVEYMDGLTRHGARKWAEGARAVEARTGGNGA
jgi:hypothetical protein